MPTPVEEVGSVTFALDLGGGAVHISSLGYQISASTFSKTGTLNVGNSATLSGIIAGIPAGRVTPSPSAAPTTPTSCSAARGRRRRSASPPGPSPRSGSAAIGWMNGCSQPPATKERVDNGGDVSFALTLAPGLSLNTVTYTITGPNAFTKSGSIDVSHSATVSAVISGRPRAPASISPGLDRHRWHDVLCRFGDVRRHRPPDDVRDGAPRLP